MRRQFTVLFVEDDPGVLEILPELLPAGEFECLTAGNGEDAMRLLAQHPVDVLFTDVMMDGLDGIELAKRARQLVPGLKVVLMTGHLFRAREALSIAPVVYKPARLDEIELAIRSVIANGGFERRLM